MGLPAPWRRMKPVTGHRGARHRTGRNKKFRYGNLFGKSTRPMVVMILATSCLLLVGPPVHISLGIDPLGVAAGTGLGMAVGRSGTPRHRR